MVVKKHKAILLHRALINFPKHVNSRDEADCFPFVATDVRLHDVYMRRTHFEFELSFTTSWIFSTDFANRWGKSIETTALHV